MAKKNLLYLILLIGFLFRIIIGLGDYHYDATNHMIWGKDAAKHGLPGFYERTSANYPPLTTLTFSFIFFIKDYIYRLNWLSNIQIPFFPPNFNYYSLLIKLPAIISDIGIAYVTYLFIQRIIRNKKSVWPIIASLFILFNPAYFYNSAYWGQVDSMPLFFVLVSFYLLIFTNKSVHSGVAFTFALLSKQTAVVFLPLFLLLFLKKSKAKQIIITLASSFIIFISFFIPFYRSGNIILYPFITYWNKILTVSGLFYTSNHAFNFWYLLTGSMKIEASAKYLFNMSYELWGYAITGLINVFVLIKLIKRKFQPHDVIFAGTLIPFSAFFFLTKMHERHLIIALPFLLIVFFTIYHPESYEIGQGFRRLILSSFVYLSLFNFLNMYHNWWSPEIPILIHVLSSTLIINLLTSLVFGVFVLLFKNYLKQDRIL